MPAVTVAATLRETLASFAVGRLLIRFVKTTVPMRNPTTKHTAQYAVTPPIIKTRCFFETELLATAAGKSLTVSKFAPGSASVPGFKKSEEDSERR